MEYVEINKGCQRKSVGIMLIMTRRPQKSWPSLGPLLPAHSVSKPLLHHLAAQEEQFTGTTVIAWSRALEIVSC